MSRKFNQLFYDSKSWTRNMVFPAVEFTPELAAEFLRINGKNRPVRLRIVREYANQMKLGKWTFTGDVIRVSKTGLILDGQHRLMAVVESQTTQTWNLQTGLPDAVFDQIDIGAGRTASDAVAVKGIKNYTVISGAAKLIMAYTNGQVKAQAQGGKAYEKFTNHQIIEFLEKEVDMDLMEEAAGIGNKCAYRAKWYSGSTYAAFYYLFALKDRDAAILFFELLTTGENISANSFSMLFLLRNKLINIASSNTMFRTVDKYALLIKAWNAFRKGREIKQLSWQPKEDFPVIA